MGVFQKIGNALARLMYGRNGVDQLSLAIVVGSLVLDLVSMFEMCIRDRPTSRCPPWT